MKSLLVAPTLVLSALQLVAAAPLPDVSDTLQNILQNTHKSNLYTYPTDLTRGIIPKPFHSHNDYWRDVPFYSALSYGAVSTEADVWLINGTLYVGHEISALTTARTLDALYIQPILDTLHRQNPRTPFVTTETRNGVFDADAGQTLYFFIDLKTSPSTTFPAVLEALAPLRDAGYLTTYFSNGTLSTGPVTIIGTGNTQLADVLALANDTDSSDESTVRDIFYDAPLATLNDTAYDAITGPHVSPIASTDFAASFGSVVAESLTEAQLALLRAQVAGAHARGVKARYWDQPGFPIGTRNAVWRVLVDEGVDLLNVDDLEGVVGFWDNEG